MKFKEIYSTLDIAELELLKASLHHHGIKYRVFDEQTLYSAGTYAMGFSGARIQVPVKDETEALEILMSLFPEIAMGYHKDERQAEWLERAMARKNSLVFLKRIPLFIVMILPILLVILIIALFLLII
ncbi:MAG TPA: DUF2007 domain-containing protein [Saprospiraceae bacterium]|nr:DUF2007 domain-containing protein [Saprospiraceae bacterium]